MIKIVVTTFIQFAAIMAISVGMLYVVASHGDYKQGIVKLLK